MQDYYAFGMQMPGRKLSGGYRYGFNGKENDNEVKGEENQQDYGLRIYDTRLGKFLSVDPLTKEYPWYTPYQFAGNTPIQAIDLDGGEPKVAGKEEAANGKDIVYEGTGTGGYGQVERNWKWHMGGLSTSSGKKTQANWYSPDDYLNLLSKTNAAVTIADKLNLFSNAAKGWQKSSANAGKGELENFVGDGSNDNAASSILRAAQIRANNANKHVSGRADLSSVNVEDFIGVGLLLKQLVKPGITIGVGDAAKGGLSNARALGIAGEEAVGVGAKTRIPSLTGTAKYRIPDQLTSTTLREVKNVGHQSLTRQLMYFHLYSQQTGRQFILYTRPNTTFSGPLQNLINNGNIITKPIPFR